MTTLRKWWSSSPLQGQCSVTEHGISPVAMPVAASPFAPGAKASVEAPAKVLAANISVPPVARRSGRNRDAQV